MGSGPACNHANAAATASNAIKFGSKLDRGLFPFMVPPERALGGCGREENKVLVPNSHQTLTVTTLSSRGHWAPVLTAL
jgi:hypothetical protein